MYFILKEEREKKKKEFKNRYCKGERYLRLNDGV